MCGNPRPFFRPWVVDVQTSSELGGCVSLVKQGSTVHLAIRNLTTKGPKGRSISWRRRPPLTMETYGNPHFGCIFVQPPGKDWANALAAECISSGTAALFQSSASCRMVHSVKVLILMLIQRIFGVLVIDKLIFERMRCWDITIMISYVQLSKSFAVFRSRGAHLHGSMHSANHQGVTSLRCP